MNTAQDIRLALKNELGLNRTKVGVRRSGGAIYVTIKDAEVSRDDVALVSKRSEMVRRCEHSGEILAGGNVFVFVDHSRDVLRKFRAEALAALKGLDDAAEGRGVAWRGLELWRDRFGSYWASAADEARRLDHYIDTAAHVATHRVLA